MVFTTEEFFEAAIESWPELATTTKFRSDGLTD